MRHWVFMAFFIAGSFACGAVRPDANDYRSKRDANIANQGVDTEDDSVDSESGDDSTSSPTNSADALKPNDVVPPTPAVTTPVVPKAPIRTLANAAEIASAQAAYGVDCAGCHMPLATSAKKAVTLARLNAAGVAGAVAPHTTLINAAKWPTDVKDTTDDGIDTAMLKAAAFVEALK